MRSESWQTRADSSSCGFSAVTSIPTLTTETSYTWRLTLTSNTGKVFADVVLCVGREEVLKSLMKIKT